MADDIISLYRELDPLRPLESDEEALYVDWQHAVDPGGADVKARLVRVFQRNASPTHPITRLLTGHKGCGKTTELNRVSSRLRAGERGSRIFVSTLFAQRWLDLDDVQPEDLLLQIVRQLVADLAAEGMILGEQRFGTFMRSLWNRLSTARFETVDIGVDPLKFSFRLKDFPSARSEFRDLLRAQLPTIFDLVNEELLPQARQFIAGEGYDDILLICDDLDKIPQKILGEQRVSNHESLFLDHAATLRALNCSLLLTIPIELAYSPAQGRLRDEYGAAIATVPLVPVADRTASRIEAGETALAEILGRRAERALSADEGPVEASMRIFDEASTLRRVVQLSGAHVRSLLVNLTEMLNWVDALPVTADVVSRYATRTAKDLARGLFAADKEILHQVRATNEAIEDPRFFDLLRNHYVFAYEAGADEYWYGVNPLLNEIDLR